MYWAKHFIHREEDFNYDVLLKGLLIVVTDYIIVRVETRYIKLL